jgi:exodeoxyribonuclease V beta subunit
MVKATIQAVNSESLHIKECLNPVINNWRLSSFSSITKLSHDSYDPFDFKQGALDENHQLDWLDSAKIEQLNEFSFPKGANPGSCLHAIMEEIDFNHPHNPIFKGKRVINDVIAEQLKHYHIDQHWQLPVANWIEQLLKTPLTPHNFALKDLDMEQCLIEMEFMLPVSDLVTGKLNTLLLKQSQVKFPALSSQTISGMLKGFIDLIFCYEGRYYVLDYKSNYLGNIGDDYSPENMENVMSSHHYHLQYLLYTVALHRMLKHRVANYNIEQHLGGSIYLFLRGMPSGNGIYYKPLDIELINELDRLFDKGMFDA